MYSCDEVIAELANYLDDRVAAAIRQELELHLAHCPTCRVIYDSTRKTLRIVTESRAFELPAGITTRVMEKIRLQKDELSKAGPGGKRRRPRNPNA